MKGPRAALWTVRLLNGPRLESAQSSITRFRSKKVSALLAFLAMRLGQPCSREELCEALWPNEKDSAARLNRFRVALASLRRQLEPEGFPYDSVLDTTISGCVALRAEVVRCDIEEIDSALRRRDFQSVANLLVGPLMPGFTDEWLHDEQLRFLLLTEDYRHLRTAETSPAPNDPRSGPLPRYLSPFFGRKQELVQVSALLEHHRLVTIVGWGGIGKTRLALEIAWRWEAPASYVSLGDCAQSEVAAERIISGLGFASQTVASAWFQLGSLTRQGGSQLIVLDGAENLEPKAVEEIERWITESPDLRLLVSSRRRLDIPGEAVFPLQPLSDADHESAVEIFLSRARQSRPDLRVGVRQLEAISRIVRRLSSIPLAIELAASQISTRTVGQILEGIEAESDSVMSKVSRSGRRQQTLAAVLESSLAVLPDEVLHTLKALSQVEGSFSVDLARTVTCEIGVEDHLEFLTQHSFLQARDRDRFVTFTGIDVVMESVATRSTESEKQRSRSLLMDYARQALRAVDPDNLKTLAPIDASRTPVLESALRSPEIIRDWESTRGAIEYLFLRGQHRQALHTIEACRRDLHLCEDLRIRQQWISSALQTVVDLGIPPLAKEFIAELRQMSLPSARTSADLAEGLLEAREGNLETAIQLHRRALQTTRDEADAWSLRNTALAHLSGTLHDFSRTYPDHPETKEHLRQATSFAEQLLDCVPANSYRLPLAQLLLGAAKFYQGRLDEAQETLTLCKAAAQSEDMLTPQMYCAYFESRIASALGDEVGAEQSHHRFLHLQQRTGVNTGRLH